MLIDVRSSGSPSGILLRAGYTRPRSTSMRSSRRAHLPLLLAALAGGAATSTSAAQVSTFTGLSTPLGPSSEVVTVTGVSADGSVVVGGALGRARGDYSYTSFRWRRDSGFDEPVAGRPAELTGATGVSADGCVVIGSSSSASGARAWVCSGGSIVFLEGRALAGISPDGFTAVGWTVGGGTPVATDRAGFYSVPRATWTDLSPPVGLWHSRATSVSEGGKVIAGVAGVRSGEYSDALAWHGTSITRLPSRAGVLGASTVRISASGERAAGSHLDLIDDPIEGAVHDRAAWVWSAADGFTEIGGEFEVRAISPDGRVVAGSRVSAEYGTPHRAMMWDDVRGPLEASDVLGRAGLSFELTGWILLTADAVTQQGETYVIAGTGVDPQNRRAAWVATIALPPAALHQSGGERTDGGEPALGAHVDQALLTAMVRSGNRLGAMRLAFDTGDLLFNTALIEADGVGSNIGDGSRFTRVPRPDLAGPGQWATHLPPRTTGPSAASCNACHSQPFDDGAGGPERNVLSDPLRTGRAQTLIQRNPPHLFGAGAVQRLAEEMTVELRRTAQELGERACREGRSVTIELSAKGVSFGSLVASPSTTDSGTPQFDSSGVRGVSADLIVRPFQWKGSFASLREFSRDAAHREVGVQAVELVGQGVDGDGDGVVNELSVGDITALAVYIAGQPRPTTTPELARLGITVPVEESELAAIERGRAVFFAARCAECHVPALKLDAPDFSEPSSTEGFFEAVFPNGRSAESLALSQCFPVLFDLTRDHPDNAWTDPERRLTSRLGSFEHEENGRVVVELYGDLKRHDMGPALAEPVDETGTGASTFLTENLWGVGSTAPYLHDGRATTLAEAILLHGGDAQASRDTFAAMPEHRRNDLVAFLKSLVIFKNE